MLWSTRAGLALCLALQGCVGLDGLIAKSDAGEAEAGDADTSLEPQQRDASEEDASEQDASEQDALDATTDAAAPDAMTAPEPQIEAGLGIVDAGLGIVDAAQPVACTSQLGCNADELCGPFGTCVSRCDPSGLCIVQADKRGILDVTGDGEAVYWRVQASTDALGNPGMDGEVWRKQPDQSARMVTDQATTNERASPRFRARDGYLYYLKSASLYRKALTPNAPPQLVTALPSNHPSATTYWDAGHGAVVFMVTEGIFWAPADGSAPLAKLWSPTSETLGGSVAIRGDKVVFWDGNFADPYQTFLRAIGLGTATQVETLFEATGIFSQFLRITGSTIPELYGRYVIGFCNLSDFSLCRFESSEQSRVRVAGFGGKHSIGADPVIVGDWLYWAFSQGDTLADKNESGIVRFSLSKVGVHQALVPLRTGQRQAPSIGVVADRLYLAPEDPTRTDYLAPYLYELRLPPAPCAADLPCAAIGQSCGADGLCH